MGLSSSINRVREYYRRHGFKSTISRARLAVKRELFSGRMVVFYCDLAMLPSRAVVLPDSTRIDRLTGEPELSRQDLEVMMSFWNPKQARYNIKERFAKGASLWLIRLGDDLAGYGWTIHGRPIAPFYFPIGPEDVQLFDFYVFPKYRGRAIHWVLTAYILQALKAEGRARAFADTAEWNQAQLSSFKMTPFQPLGKVRSFTFLGRRLNHWNVEEPGKPALEVSETRFKRATMARPHGQ